MKKISALCVISFFICTTLFSQSGPLNILSTDLQLFKLAEGVYRHESFMEWQGFRFGSNGLIVISDGEAILIDTPVSDTLTELLLQFLEEDSIKVVAAVPTHWHDDCLGGLSAVHDHGIQSYAYTETCSLAQEHGYEVPKIPFTNNLRLSAGGTMIEFAYLGGGHSTDNIVAYIRSKQILFGGCLIKSAEAKNLGNTADADIDAWPETIRQVKKHFSDVKIVVPGHGNIGEASLPDHTLKLLAAQ
jgi:metallo-beta-lactamase class B